jgi:phytoene dehydrogenase-like protein
MARLEAVAPGIGRLVRHADLLTPADLERRYGLPGGHWHQVEWQVDQLFALRPTLGAAGYATPLPGLYVGSAGSHPGGGVTGLPGLNAARALLATEARR